MKLIVDMNLSPSWCDRLARHGFEADAVARALSKYSEELQEGALLSIDAKGTRVRILPLRRSPER